METNTRETIDLSPITEFPVPIQVTQDWHNKTVLPSTIVSTRTYSKINLGNHKLKLAVII